MSLEPTLSTTRPGVARVQWPDALGRGDFREAIGLVRHLVTQGLLDHGRVEAWVDVDDVESQRIATWSGLHREGVMRGAEVVDGARRDRILYARLDTDVPVSEPQGFRALLNAFLPRKRAIGQMLVRDTTNRVLMCELTYKKDWDLPGGVVEVGEAPHLGVTREMEEELGLHVPAGPVLLTDWLPAWSGWDDALCLVFDGGVHLPELVDSAVLEKREIRALHFCTPEEVRAHAADFTARRVESALQALRTGARYTESGHAPSPPDTPADHIITPPGA